jgi:hypothetical protein
VFNEHPGWVFKVALVAALAIKLAGYLAAAKVFNTAFESKRGILVPALVRTGIGAVCGYLYASAWGMFGPSGPSLLLLLVFYLGLFASRVGQWWAVLWMFWEGAARAPARGWACAIVGALWSHFLDLPAFVIYAFTVGKLLPIPDGLML